jgi:hypothetical protein
MRKILFLAAVLPVVVLAQTAPMPSEDKPVKKERPDQKIERIHIDDGGATIDELRVGGQSQNVTVKPAGKAPAYEMQPTDGARSRPSDQQQGDLGKNQRVWNVLKF